MSVWYRFGFVLTLFLCNGVVAADGQEKPPDQKKDDKPAFLKEELVETSHQVRINGAAMKYTATAGTFLLKEEDDKERGTIFFIAYTAAAAEAQPSRPVTFVFNGGPGSSSVWLHLGAFGPRRIDMGEGEVALPPPYQLSDNEYSILDLTDLVFIDPVSTGFSRPVSSKRAKEFHGVRKDIESVAEFIRLYTTRHSRWGSPKFLAGESYGTVRAAGLASHLQEEMGMYINGILLISSVLNFQTIRFDPGNDLPYLLFLPTYAAAAWYHGQLASDRFQNLESLLDEVRRFALEEYSIALLKGSDLDASERDKLAAKLAAYTGFDISDIKKNQLRIPIFRFTKELLSAQRRIIGRFDARVTGIDPNPADQYYAFDPSYSSVYGASSSTLNDYVRKELHYESDLPYEILSGRVRPWDYGKYQNRYLDLTDSLLTSLTRNPYLKVFVASGYYDLATPFFATDYTFSHLGLDPSLTKNMQYEYYEAGHMMYFHEPSLAKLKSDLVRFFESAL